MTVPKVSVITATYNWSSVLRYAIQSVVWQTFQDFEYIIVGDACTDDSAEVVASFGDLRLRWHNLTENSGSQSIPNNMGLQMAQGTYIAYLGHDDLWYPTHLQSLVSVMDATQADICCAITELVGAPGTDIRLVSGIGTAETTQRKPPPSSIMHRRDVLELTGLWKDYRTISIAPDHEFIKRVREYRERFSSTNTLTVFKFPAAWRANSYREKHSSEQADYVRRMQSELDFVEKEWVAITLALLTGTGVVPPVQRPDNAPLGWLVEQYRKTKGLDAKAALNTKPAIKLSLFRPLTRPARFFLRRILRKMLRMLED